jgi:hypothetical protein
MTDIPLPDSVIEAGDKAALRLFRDDPMYRERLTDIFLAMAKALVEHDRGTKNSVFVEGASKNPVHKWDKFTAVRYMKACYEAQETAK